MAGGGAGHAGSDGLTAFLAGAGALGGLERAGEPLKAAQLALQLQAPSFLPAEVDDAPQGPPPGGSAPSSPSPVAAGVALQGERGEMRPEPLEAAPQQPQQQRDEAEARQALATARPAPPPQPAEAAPPRAQSYTVTRKELPTATPFPSALQPCPADGTKRTHASPPPAICCKLRARGRPARKRLPLPVPLACSGWLLWASSAPSALRGGGGWGSAHARGRGLGTAAKLLACGQGRTRGVASDSGRSGRRRSCVSPHYIPRAPWTRRGRRPARGLCGVKAAVRPEARLQFPAVDNALWRDRLRAARDSCRAWARQ